MCFLSSASLILFSIFHYVYYQKHTYVYWFSPLSYMYGVTPGLFL